MNFVQIYIQFSSDPWGPITGTNFIISCEVGPRQVKLYHMFSSMNMKKYIKFELSSIFRVKLVAKNIVLSTNKVQRQSDSPV